MACLTRLERLKLVESCNERTKDVPSNDFLQLRTKNAQILEDRDVQFIDFYQSLVKEEGKIRGRLKLDDLHVFLGVESGGVEATELSVVKSVFQRFSARKKYGNVHVDRFVFHHKRDHAHQGISNIVEGAMRAMRSAHEAAIAKVEKARKVAERPSSPKALEKKEKEEEAKQYTRKENYYIVGLCTGFYDLKKDMSADVAHQMNDGVCFYMSTTAVCIGRGDLLPGSFEISLTSPVHVPVLSRTFVDKSMPAKHERYLRNEIEYNQYVRRRWKDIQKARREKRSADEVEAEEKEHETTKRSPSPLALTSASDGPPDVTRINTFDLCCDADLLHTAMLTALGTLNRRYVEKVPDAMRDGVERPSITTIQGFMGKWWLQGTENSAEFFKAIGIGRTRRIVLERQFPIGQEIMQAGEGWSWDFQIDATFPHGGGSGGTSPTYTIHASDIAVIPKGSNLLSTLLSSNGNAQTQPREGEITRTNIAGDTAFCVACWTRPAEDATKWSMTEMQRTKRGVIVMTRRIENAEGADPTMVVEWRWRNRRSGSSAGRSGSRKKRSGSGKLHAVMRFRFGRQRTRRSRSGTKRSGAMKRSGSGSRSGTKRSGAMKRSGSGSRSGSTPKRSGAMKRSGSGRSRSGRREQLTPPSSGTLSRAGSGVVGNV